MKTKILAVILAIILLAMPVASAGTAEDQALNMLLLTQLIDAYSLYAPEDGALFQVLQAAYEKDPELFNDMVDVLFANMDRYSQYIASGYERMYSQNENYVGIGVEIDTKIQNSVVVRGVMEGSPAQEAGVKAGDVIVSVDGKDVRGLPPAEVTPGIRGEEGTTVVIGFLRPSDQKTYTFTIERRAITSPNIYISYPEPGIGCIEIRNFGSINDVITLVRAYRTMPYEGVRSVIFDVRGNPGGVVDVLYNVLDNIVREQGKWLFALKGRGENEYTFFNASGAGTWKPNEMVVLINGESASAAEMFAGTLRDFGYATLVGTTSYGKARSQIHVPLPDDSVVVLTTGEIVLPISPDYEGEGITPDIEVENNGGADMLLPLDTTVALLPVTTETPSERVKAVQQRLQLLGLYSGEPDGLFSVDTMEAVHEFQQTRELEVQPYLSPEALRLLQTDAVVMAGETVRYDAQMQTALDIARKGAAQELRVKPSARRPDMSVTYRPKAG